MTVKILIKRRFVKGKSREIYALFNKLRSEAMNLEGYLSGETLVDPVDHQKMLVISTWSNMDNWLTWKNSESRKNVEKMLEVYQEGPTDYEEYVLGMLAES